MRSELEGQLQRAEAARATPGAGPRTKQLENELWDRDNQLQEAQSLLRESHQEVQRMQLKLKQAQANEEDSKALKALSVFHPYAYTCEQYEH